GRICVTDLSADRKAVRIATGYLSFITKGHQGGRTGGDGDTGPGGGSQRSGAGRGGIPAPPAASLHVTTRGFSESFPTYGPARGTALAFPYTGLWCTCRTVPVASSGHSVSPGADGRIAFVAGGHDCGEVAACRNFRCGGVRMEEPDRGGNAGEAVAVVGERTGPHPPVKLSGAIPPLAESFHQRPETGLDLRAGLYPGDTVVLTHGEDTPAAPAAQGGTGKTQIAVAFSHALWGGRQVDALAWVRAGSPGGAAARATRWRGSGRPAGRRSSPAPRGRPGPWARPTRRCPPRAPRAAS